MLDWDKLRIFYAVAQTKNITKAGDMLGLSQSAISRQITALEDQLKHPIFHRRARGLLLTEQGELLLRTVSEFVQKLTDTEHALTDLDERPKGTLRVSVPVALGTFWLIPLIKEFNELYPDVHIALMVDDREHDLSAREADVAIRMHPPKQPDLIQRQLITINSSMYASNDYLRVHGVPQSLGDLKNHRIICYTEMSGQLYEGVNWHIRAAKEQGVNVTPYFSVNNMFGILRAVKSGMGIAAMPDYMVLRARHISRVLDGLDGPTNDAYLVYPMDMKNSRRIKAFRSFVERKIAEYVF
ncbi:MAG: LysR family transcriptional regulator [Rickettsiales bacterium]